VPLVEAAFDIRGDAESQNPVRLRSQDTATTTNARSMHAIAENWRQAATGILAQSFDSDRNMLRRVRLLS